MKPMLEELRRYLNETPQNQIEEDWLKTEKYDEAGVTIDEFLQKTHYYFKLGEANISWQKPNFLNNIQNPKFTSDFLILQHEQSRIFN
ncbi:hypothetical protein [Parasediminibacterium sp. JCM 36343]|uniref:hypothetical protein n=1 Tax=Parasediminibacterium sp. JCM 36343 TaxID=3374279 RepID=UPI0039794CA7